MTHRYRLYGFRVDSCLPCPTLPPGEGPADVEIREGPVAAELPGAVKRGVLFQAAPGRFHLAIDGIARYLVTDGREIVVDPAPGADEGSVRVFLLGSVMGALLYQRGFLPLHASAIRNGDGVVAFAGHSGRGKSTLAAAFARAGYTVMADDVCAVRVDAGGVPLVYPAYPGLRLWADALRKLEIDPDRLARARPELDKSILPTDQPAEQDPLPLTRVYVLSPANRAVLELEPIEGMSKLNVLSIHTYRRQFVAGLGHEREHFRVCVAIARHAKVVRVLRSSTGFQLDELRERIAADFTAVESPA